MIGEHVLDVGGHWEYQLHITEDPDAGPVDWWGTTTSDIVREETIEGYETVLFEETGQIPGVESWWFKANYYLTSEYVVEVRSEDEGMIYLVRDNDPLENSPVWVNESDSNRHYGHGEHYGTLKDPYYTWDGHRDKYVTFLRTETITVPAGSFDCVVLFVRQESHEFAGIWMYSEGTVWANPAVGSVKGDEYIWMWDPIEEKASEGRLTAELTFVSLPEPEKATNPVPINGSGSEGVAVELNWSDGGGAYTFDVYFGTDFDDVNDANNPYITPGRGNQSELTYEPGLLAYDRTYYWRIDSDNTITTTKGDVWSFRTEIPELSDDGYVWMEDLAILVSYWLDETCAEPNWCEGADLNRSGSTDFYDYNILARYWCGDTSLVGYWKMDDDASNPTVLDSSCYGNHGIAQQNTYILHSTGIIDGALTFDGTSDYVDCGNDVSLDIAGSISISAWVRFDSFPIRQTIVAKRGALGDTGTNYALRTGSQADIDELEFYYHDGASRHVYTTSNANLIGGAWHHIVVTFTFGTGTSIQCYLNNNLLSGGWRRGDGNSAVQTNAKPVTIGGLTTGVNQRVDGAIDNVMIFNRALSTEEIQHLYQDGQN
ncbi:MAG: LamG domain-containing protein [Planctomycetota bacterium]